MNTSKPDLCVRRADVELPFTGERVVPGKTPQNIFLETQARYLFAGQYVKGRRVLDVASGTGIGTHYLVTAGAKHCLGVDADLATLEYASSSYGSERCQFAISNACELCVAKGSVDVVVSFETIEHLQNPLAFLRECARVLAPDGVFICSTPDRDFFRWMPANPFHVSEMTPAEFVNAVREVFPQCSLYGQGAVNYPLYITQMLARRYLSTWIGRSKVTAALKRCVMKRDNTVAEDLEFAASAPTNEQHEIVPYRRGLTNRFPYVLVTAIKGASSMSLV